MIIYPIGSWVRFFWGNVELFTAENAGAGGALLQYSTL